MHWDRETIHLSRIALELSFIFGSGQTKGRTALERG